MTGSSRCLPGCTCKKHQKVGKIDWSDPEARKAYHREQARLKYAEDPEPSRAASRKWSQGNRNYARYCLTNKEWQGIFDQQNGACYLCEDSFDVENDRKSIHVDHDHACCPGERSCGSCIRGLACRRCNKGIGRFLDDPARMRRVADALEAAQAKLKKQ